MTERKKYGITPLSASGKEKYISGAADFGAAARHGPGFHTQQIIVHFNDYRLQTCRCKIVSDWWII